MVAIAIAATMLSLGVPSYQAYIANQRVKSASFEFLASLVFARSEALKRNAKIDVAPTGEWQAGWSVQMTDASNVATLLRSHGEMGGVGVCQKMGADFCSSTDASAAETISFNGDGRMAAGGTSTFTLKGAPAASSIKPHCITLTTLSPTPKSKLSNSRDGETCS